MGPLYCPRLCSFLLGTCTMKSVWITHGQCEYTVQNLIAGWHDPELTEQGMAEAKHIATILADKYVEIANVYCSDLRRSFNTARIVCESTPWGKTQQVSPFIRDRDFGDITGTQSQIPQEWKTSLVNGESLQDTASRVYSFLKEIEDRSNELPHIIICHSDTVRAAAVVLGKRTPHDIQNFEVYNTGEIIEWDF